MGECPEQLARRAAPEGNTQFLGFLSGTHTIFTQNIDFDPL